MAAKKNYSRYFIILQEDEKGFSSDASKFPTGYAKIEKKSEKCKVSYYVQNLKKDKEPYYMILICDKKSEKKLIKLGEMNIDDYGRAEISYEYDINNIAYSGMSMDKIKGAAVVNFQDSNMKSVLTGFISGVRLNDWKNYYMIQNKAQSRQDTNDNVETNEVIVEDKKVKTDSTNLQHESKRVKENKVKDKKAKEEIVKDEKVKDEKVKEEIVENNNRKLEEVDDVNKNKSKDDIFDKYENDIEQYKNINDDTSEGNDRLEDINDSVDSKNNDDIDNDETDNSKIDKVIDNTPKAEEYRGEEVRDKHKDKYECKCKEKYECKCKKSDQEYPIGVQGEFFKNLAKGLEEVSDVCPEVGKCKWYKVPVDSLEDINKTTDLNKYTVVYYPMICYYPYIKKYGHYLLGYKCDSKGKMRYLVYAIPGTKVMHDQPFGGTTGFATWVCKDYREDKMYSTGYWVMFYDFKNSRVMVPVI